MLDKHEIRTSFIIVSRDATSAGPAIQSIARSRASPHTYEILLATGRNPSAQRNSAARQASGEFLVFLDDDSEIDPRLLEYYADALGYEGGIGIVGGPSGYAARDSLFKTAVHAVSSSVFGLGPFRSRYVSIGHVRRTSERELILCNMLIRRSLFLDEGGFDVRLYPNEENEFLNRVQSRTKIYYHPLALCYRDPRGHLAAFLGQMFAYGRGRARDLALFPQFWDAIFLLPILFALYCMVLPFALWVHGSWIMLAPLLLYLSLDLAASGFAALGRRDLRMVACIPALFFLCHLSYGLGLIFGFLTHPFSPSRPAKKVEQVEVLTLKPFDDDNLRLWTLRVSPS